VRFLVEQGYTNAEWEDEKECEKIYLDFLNWVFVGRHVPSSSINITCSAISKFFCAFIPQFNFAQTKLIKNIRKGFMTSNPKAQISNHLESGFTNRLLL
jgi:uncharacterized protein YsxB (DUF464 family)